MINNRNVSNPQLITVSATIKGVSKFKRSKRVIDYSIFLETPSKRTIVMDHGQWKYKSDTILIKIIKNYTISKFTIFLILDIFQVLKYELIYCPSLFDNNNNEEW